MKGIACSEPRRWRAASFALAFVVFAGFCGMLACGAASAADSAANVATPAAASGAAASTAGASGPKRIYIAPDDHTDYMWTMDEAGYRAAFIKMIDYYVAQADATAANAPSQQARWNCDGSFWLWEYEHAKPDEFPKVIEKIRSGHMSAPLTALVSCYGGQPAEAVLRGMYYAGSLERRYQLRFPLAVAMEDQTLPYGLGALWAGSGAQYTWKGICNCASHLPSPGEREHEIYWWMGPDGSRLLMKWNSMAGKDNKHMGGYAEAYNTPGIVDYVDKDPKFIARYPYRVIGAFGKGWDHAETLTDEFITVAKEKSDAARNVIVSNESDFFKDFDATYGQQIPEVGCAFGNEWDLYSASMSEVCAQVRRAVEKLRAAEAMAALVALKRPEFGKDQIAARDLAWIDLGIFWEHDWTADARKVTREDRAKWQRRLAKEIAGYVDGLQESATQQLGELIAATGSAPRFFAFNALSWTRSDVADIPWSDAAPVHVVEVASGAEVPSQRVTLNGKSYVRILAKDVPPLGYKVYEVLPGAGQAAEVAARFDGGVFENKFYRLTIAPRGAVTSLVDKTQGNREFAREIDGRWINDLGAGGGELSVENAGPISATVVAKSEGPLKHVSRITLYADNRRIDFDNEIQQNFGDVRTWSFAFNLQKPDVHHEEIGAVIRANVQKRGGQYADRNARYDWLTLNHFVDMGGNGDTGVTLSNADLAFMRIGHSTAQILDDATPLIEPLAGGNVDGPRLGIHFQGGDRFFRQRFALATRAQYSPVAAMRLALEHQNPLACGKVSGAPQQAGSYPPAAFSLLKTSQDEVFVWAVKPAEEGIEQGLIVRLWNLRPAEVDAKLQWAIQPKSATRTSHIETDLENVSLSDGTLKLDMQPQQLQTYRFRMQ